VLAVLYSTVDSCRKSFHDRKGRRVRHLQKESPSTEKTYYKIARQGVFLGEWNSETIWAKLRRGELAATDDCWTEGMEEWVPVFLVFPPPRRQ
jgi:hypothetical protein